ncbi:acetylcholinesterase-like [Porites lutea]|uniref:acetylcholinesterase-like n=1 Tax=Porites lutea TaxID=51062 RepID=UPI003CC50BF9
MNSLTAVLFLITFLVSRSYSITAPTVTTTYGPVSGTVTQLPTNKTVKSYLGIPFAQAKRFEDPVPPNKWTSTLHANATRSVCPQHVLQGTEYQRPLFNEEHCLMLSVYIPENATSGSRLAVMLWIHGGAFLSGDTLSFNGAVLATEGNVIVIVAAYRLAALGFLSSRSSGLRGNYGMMDQVEAMKWVNKNIASFGGDPDKVTIFGESAGGASVGLLMLSPLARGLFQNAIMQSGTAAVLWAVQERNEADSVARHFAKLLGCDESSLKQCAKKKTFQEITDAQSQIYPKEHVLTFCPVVDGYFLPDSPLKLLKAGNFSARNVMVGVTREDGSIFLAPIPGFVKALNVLNGISREVFKEQIKNRVWTRPQTKKSEDLLIYEYTDWSNASDPIVLRKQFIHLLTDSYFKAPAVESADLLVKKQLPTYFYQLEIAPKINFGVPIPDWYGIFHGADIFYTFGFPLLSQKNLTTETEIIFSKKFMTLWSNFAKTGNPNSPTPLEITWPQYKAEREEYAGLGANLTVRSKIRPEKMALWNEFLPEQFLALEEPTTQSSKLATAEAMSDDNKDTLVLILAILTGVFGAVAVILLVALILIRCKRRHQPASGIFSSKGSSSSDELSDSAALPTKEEGACKLARKAAMFVLNHSRPRPSAYASDSWPSCAEEFWVICTKCRKRHYQIRQAKQLETTVVESLLVIQDQEPSVLMTFTNESPERPNISSTSAYESEVDISAMDSVIETEEEAETSLWIDEKELQHEKRETLNNAVAKLTEGRYSPIASTLNTSWDDVSVTQQKYYQRKMKEVIQAALSVVVPGQEEHMWNCLREETEIADVSEQPPAKRKRIDTGLVQTLISAHNDAENWQTKRQILSLFVNDFSKTELQEMMPGLSKWRIDQARCHATDVGEGQPIHDKPIFRARLDHVKTDHFVDYISRPCFLQDVAYGTRKLKLDSGGHAVIPAVIRTLIPSRIIAQYQA